jgi:hypothetical protein
MNVLDDLAIEAFELCHQVAAILRGPDVAAALWWVTNP